MKSIDAIEPNGSEAIGPPTSRPPDVDREIAGVSDNFADLGLSHQRRRPSVLTPTKLQQNLNFILSIFNALILWSRVDGGIPSLAAAPEGPEIRPLVSVSAASIIVRSVRGSSSISFESHDSSTENISPEIRITDLSMMFCNSRIFPGQS